MNEELIAMIKTSQLTVEQYYLMHPFSSSSNIIYSKALSNIDYFKEFYTLSNKTFENLADIVNIVNNSVKNTIIVTGYRGCGKTNFLKFCEAVINKKHSIKKYQEVYNEHMNFLNSCGVKFLIDEKGKKKTLREEYDKSIEYIKEQCLNGQMRNWSNEKVINELSDLLAKQLEGKSEYINFGEGKANDKKPLNLKIMQVIEQDIEDIIDRKENKKLNYLVDFFTNIKNNIKNSFEDSSGYLKIYDFFKYLVGPMNSIQHVYDCTHYDLIEESLRQTLSKLESDQLLFIMLLIKMTNSSKDERNYFIFDNIDMVSDDENLMFSDIISSFWSFIRETRSFANDLRNAKKNMDWVQQFEKCNFIFAMRETTAMHICDDLRERVKQFLEHFDISNNINFNLIVHKKYLFYEKNLHSSELINEKFLKTIDNIYRIALDPFFIKNLFPLFSNDYRTAMRCIYQICFEHNEEVSEALKLINSSQGYLKYGGRGMIYRLIFNKFEDSGYLKNLDIFVKEGKHKYEMRHEFSFSRVILTILENLQKDYGARFFVNPEESVSMVRLFDFFKVFLKDSQHEEDEFVEILNQMYSLRNKTYWNHLLTFDNLFAFNTNEIKKVLKDADLKKNKTIVLRSTLAGKRYLQTMCVHFEFFACRFCVGVCNQYPLFSKNNMTYFKGINKYKFELIIKTVLNAVSNCCEHLKEFNRLVCSNDIYTVDAAYPYIYNGMFHEERIIHHHISYIDAFRRYIINDRKNANKYSDLNERIVSLIEEYLDLLIYRKNENKKFFYSEQSEDIFSKLGECIKMIKGSNYKDRRTKISLDYYSEHIQGEI